ncbi:Ribonuclease HI-related protein [Candidatus Arthromitus sp. SFB-mouse-NL]|uniref:ribonuclease H1 domain-containing protein n=1 Tax=Candidatus Arthromitus sp. SFB-mouse-NL TaxID=1508644 RepID=UPI00049AA70B|nr:viroplasmin family protein [Candidatus Arthromitus sp. SFB-mouse-NL]AID45410.1 Ribonuclease HI-related protein [Candidatus Arthromitus sp. SFB-mouse-NL]
MDKNFYVVKKGFKPDIYDNWEDCQKQIKGFSNSEYCKFKNREDAEKFLNSDTISSINHKSIITSNNDATAYITSSYINTDKEGAYGSLILHNNNKEILQEKLENDINCGTDLEIIAAQKTIQFCIDNNIKNLTLFYKSDIVAKLANGDIKAKSEINKAYVSFCYKVKQKLSIEFKKSTHAENNYIKEINQTVKNTLKKTNIKENKNSVTVDGIKNKDLINIFEIMKENLPDLSIENDSTKCDKILYRLVLNENKKQKLTVTEYQRKNKILIQGSMNDIFAVLITYINELLEPDKVHDFLDGVTKSNTNKTTLENNLNSLLPNIALIELEKLHNTLMQAVYNLNLKDDFYECSFLTFPALRGMEGFLRYILSKNGISVGDKRKFSMFKKMKILVVIDLNGNISNLNIPKN